MIEFSLQSSDPANFVVQHIDEGHPYKFRVATLADGRRVLSPYVDLPDDHRAKQLASAAGEFAVREALKLGIIDGED